MIASILNDVLSLKNEDPEKLIEYLKSINLHVFEDLIHVTPNLREAKLKILYILCAYDEDSPLVILRQDTNIEKEGICDYLQIPEYMRKHLMELHQPEMRKAVTAYLTQFAGPLYRMYKFLQIQYDDLTRDITNRDFGEKKREDENDDDSPIRFYWDQKEQGKAITEAARVSGVLKKIEAELKLQIKRLDGIEDMRKFIREGKEGKSIKKQRTGHVENNIK